MKSSTTRSSAPKKSCKGGYTMPRGDASPWQRGPRQKPYFNKKKPKAKSGKKFKQQNDGYPKYNVLLQRLSSLPAGTLLERIGGPAVEDDEVTSALSASDTIDGGVSEVLDLQDLDSCLDLPFSATQHFNTPDPGEAERFLQSVIGTPPAPPSPSGTGHAFSGHEPSLALGLHILTADHRTVKVEDTSSYVLSSPTQTVNSQPSSLILGQSPLMDDRTPSPSIEQCKKLLVPVLLASIQARDPRQRLDSGQCLRLLSDDHCRDLIRKAKKMRQQLSSVLSQETPIYQQRSGSLKRDRVHAVDTWVRNTRTRFDSANSVQVSDVSRRDSDVTPVDAAGGRLPPKAPRAMLQASKLNYFGSAQGGAPHQSMTASPTIDDHPVSLVDLVHKVIQMFPTLKPTGQAMAEIDMTNVSEGQLTAPQSAPPAQMPSPVQTAHPSSADFVSHLPTQPGTWFRQQGRQFADIVDIDVEVSDDIFYLSRERQPSRVRMPLRLCSVPVGAMMDINRGDAPAALPDIIDDAIVRQMFQWPQKGKLVVQVNPESERHKTWLPYTLESDPVDVTSCIRPGKNVFRFIQLSDLSEFTFVLVASPPRPEEAWRSWDWASLADSHTRSSSSVDDPANHLSEFTRIQQGIQVTVRS